MICTFVAAKFTHKCGSVNISNTHMYLETKSTCPRTAATHLNYHLIGQESKTNKLGLSWAKLKGDLKGVVR